MCPSNIHVINDIFCKCSISLELKFKDKTPLQVKAYKLGEQVSDNYKVQYEAPKVTKGNISVIKKHGLIKIDLLKSFAYLLIFIYIYIKKSIKYKY